MAKPIAPAKAIEPAKAIAPVTHPTAAPTTSTHDEHQGAGEGRPEPSRTTAVAVTTSKVPDAVTSTSHAKPEHTIKITPRRSVSARAVVASPATTTVGATGAAADDNAAPPTTLNSAAESETLALMPNPTPSPATSSATSHAAAAGQPTTTPDPNNPQGNGDEPQVIDLASSPASALGLNDNLLLAALVVVFALAVIALVSAGGHRGSWRQH